MPRKLTAIFDDLVGSSELKTFLYNAIESVKLILRTSSAYLSKSDGL